MTAVGGVAVAYGFVGPLLSDKFGRKPAIIGCFLLGLLGLVILGLSDGSFASLLIGSMLSFAGNAGAGILIMVVIPGESAPAHLSATAMGFNAGVGEMLGAGVMPVVIGMTADQIGLASLPWFLAAVAVILCVVALGLRETAPRLVARLASA
jgi:MFS transporter, ACS family, hexuronate transporter